MAVIPRTNPKLAILEPMMFPREISENPLRAACKLTSNSGAEVAKETTVNPITILDMLNLKDKATAALTRNSPPTTSKARPTRINKMLIIFFWAKIKKLNTIIPDQSSNYKIRF